MEMEMGAKPIDYSKRKQIDILKYVKIGGKFQYHWLEINTCVYLLTLCISLYFHFHFYWKCILRNQNKRNREVKNIIHVNDI